MTSRNNLSIRLLNLTLKELRSIAKFRNISGYKSILTSLFAAPKPSKPAFKLEEYIT